MQRKLRASLYPASAIDPAVRSALLPAVGKGHSAPGTVFPRGGRVTNVIKAETCGLVKQNVPVIQWCAGEERAYELF